MTTTPPTQPRPEAHGPVAEPQGFVNPYGDLADSSADLVMPDATHPTPGRDQINFDIPTWLRGVKGVVGAVLLAGSLFFIAMIIWFTIDTADPLGLILLVVIAVPLAVSLFLLRSARRPRVHISPEKVEVANFYRSHEIEWSEVKRVYLGGIPRVPMLDLHDGRQIPVKRGALSIWYGTAATLQSPDAYRQAPVLQALVQTHQAYLNRHWR